MISTSPSKENGSAARGARNTAWCFRQTDEDNFYSFGITDQGQFGVFVMTGGEWKSLQDWTQSTAIAVDKVNKLAVWGEGARFVCFINDTPVTTVDDDRFTAGEVGLLIEAGLSTEAVVVFDTFELGAAPEPPKPVVVPSPATTRSAASVEPDDSHCVHTPAEKIPADMTLMVCDSFSSSWNVTDSDVENVTERRTVEDGRYRWSVATEHGALSQASLSFGAVEDFYLTTEAQQLSGADDAEYGLLFRKTSDDNLYLFSISGGSFGVFALRNGEWSAVADWEQSVAIRPGAINRLTIRAKGARTAFFINEQRVLEIHRDCACGWRSGPGHRARSGDGCGLSSSTISSCVRLRGRALCSRPATKRDWQPVRTSRCWRRPAGRSPSAIPSRPIWTLNRLEWPLGESTNDYAQLATALRTRHVCVGRSVIRGRILARRIRTCPMYPISS